MEVSNGVLNMLQPTIYSYSKDILFQFNLLVSGDAKITLLIPFYKGALELVCQAHIVVCSKLTGRDRPVVIGWGESGVRVADLATVQPTPVDLPTSIDDPYRTVKLCRGSKFARKKCILLQD